MQRGFDAATSIFSDLSHAGERVVTLLRERRLVFVLLEKQAIADAKRSPTLLPMVQQGCTFRDAT